MIWWIIGDIIWSDYEFSWNKREDVELFVKDSYATDDTILMIATMYAILNNKPFWETYYLFTKEFPDRCYWNWYMQWFDRCKYNKNSNILLLSPAYNSMWNWAPMRSSPIGLFSKNEEEILKKAEESCNPTHNHPLWIKGWEITALMVYYTIKCWKEKAMKNICEKYNLKISENFEEYRKKYKYTELSIPTLEWCLNVFHYSKSYEDCIRKWLSLGGDADTICSIVWCWWEAAYWVPKWMIEKANTFLQEFIYEWKSFNDILKDYYELCNFQTNILMK